MKKILFFTCLALVMVGCKKEADENKPSKPRDGVNPASPAITTTCGDIVIDKTLLGTNYSAWRSNFSNLICDEIGNDIYIDLTKIPTDSDNIQKAEWLETNGSIIEYTKSKPLIIKKHKIDQTEITSIVSTNIVKVLDIKNAVGHYSYQFDKYNQYLEVSRLPFGMSKINSFLPGESFSIPFLRTILEGLPDSTNIEIIYAKIKDGTSEIPAWLIKVGSQYYNYSKWPAK